MLRVLTYIDTNGHLENIVVCATFNWHILATLCFSLHRHSTRKFSNFVTALHVTKKLLLFSGYKMASSRKACLHHTVIFVTY